MHVRLADFDFGINDECVFLTGDWRRRILDFFSKVRNETVQLVSAFSIVLGVADPVDGFVHDGGQFATPQQVDDVVSRESTLLRLEDVEKSVEIACADIGSERQLAETVAKQWEEERFVMLRTVEKRNLVEEKIG